MISSGAHPGLAFDGNCGESTGDHPAGVHGKCGETADHSRLEATRRGSSGPAFFAARASVRPEKPRGRKAEQWFFRKGDYLSGYCRVSSNLKRNAYFESDIIRNSTISVPGESVTLFPKCGIFSRRRGDGCPRNTDFGAKPSGGVSWGV